MAPDGSVGDMQDSSTGGALPFDAEQIPMDGYADEIGAGIVAAEALDYGDDAEHTSYTQGVDPSIDMMAPSIPTGSDGLAAGGNGASAVDAAAYGQSASIPVGEDAAFSAQSIEQGHTPIATGMEGAAAESIEQAHTPISSGMDAPAATLNMAAASAQSIEQGHTAIPAGISAQSEPAAESSAAPGLSGGTGSAIPMGTSGGIYTGSQEVSQTAGTQAAALAGTLGSQSAIPASYRDITMGGGRITGTEVSAKNPDGVQFAMYHTSQYTQPEGKFTTVQSLDGAKWYKQYAQPAVERTPLSEKDGKVKYNEKIVKKLPKGPPRIDRI
jgi:hypothetical protein